tara:strand:- start:176 stop:343 length:168 start_codon:yes stop_codon:yes gene_type:complete
MIYIKIFINYFKKLFYYNINDYFIIYNYNKDSNIPSDNINYDKIPMGPVDEELNI